MLPSMPSLSVEQLAGKPLRALVVDDWLTRRKELVQELQRRPQVEAVGVAPGDALPLLKNEAWDLLALGRVDHCRLQKELVRTARQRNDHMMIAIADPSVATAWLRRQADGVLDRRQAALAP